MGFGLLRKYVEVSFCVDMSSRISTMHEAVAFLLTFAEFFLPLKLLVIYQANVFPIFNEKVDKSLIFMRHAFSPPICSFNQNWCLCNVYMRASFHNLSFCLLTRTQRGRILRLFGRGSELVVHSTARNCVWETCQRPNEGSLHPPRGSDSRPIT